jgi:transcriptional regulator with XRE-family HTH domain
MNKLKELRTERGKIQREIAEYLGIDRTTYGKYETGASEPDFETTLKIAEYFDVSVDYLLGRTEEKKPSAEVIDEELDKNVLVIRGRDGRYIRKKLSDEEIKSLEILLKSLPDVSDDV